MIILDTWIDQSERQFKDFLWNEILAAHSSERQAGCRVCSYIMRVERGMVFLKKGEIL